jgi:putative transposase
MSDVYEEAYCHLVWATTRREAMISLATEALLYDYIYQKCCQKKAFVYALGGMPDHVHLICSVPSSIAVADFVQLIKGSSSHYISHHVQINALRWQRGYGYLTFAKHDLASVISYVKDQKKHHAEGKLWPKLEYLPAEDYPSSAVRSRGATFIQE